VKQGLPTSPVNLFAEKFFSPLQSKRFVCFRKEAFCIFLFPRVSVGDFQKEIYARRSMMIKSKTLRFVFLGIALVMLAIGAFAFSVSSHAAAPSAMTTTTTPHVSILKHKTGYAFGQTAVTVTHGTPFTFMNRTLASQTVMNGKKTIVTITGKSSAPFTFTKKGTFTLSLASNPAAVLTVTVQ
jgi:plastocyanin